MIAVVLGLGSTGFEIIARFHGTAAGTCDFTDCEKRCAAPVLHSDVSRWLNLSSIDTGLQSVIFSSDRLPTATRKAVTAHIQCEE